MDKSLLQTKGIWCRATLGYKIKLDPPGGPFFDY